MLCGWWRARVDGVDLVVHRIVAQLVDQAEEGLVLAADEVLEGGVGVDEGHAEHRREEAEREVVGDRESSK